jgi:hypothetical protein
MSAMSCWSSATANPFPDALRAELRPHPTALPALKRPKGGLPDERYQRTPLENDLFTSGKLLAQAEL